MSAMIDTAQIAALLGVTREHVTDKISKRPDFPPPRVNLSRRHRRWAEADIMAWLERQLPSKRAAMSATDSR